MDIRRPFIYFITEKTSGSILFLGRLSKPIPGSAWFCNTSTNCDSDTIKEDDVFLWTKRNQKFSLELLEKIDETNIVFSPISVALGLSLAHIGASGTTAQQISDALDFNSVNNPQLILRYIANGMKSSHSINEIKLVNALFANSEFRNTFIKDNSETVAADLEVVEFNRRNYTRSYINKLIEEKSLNSAKNIIPEEGIRRDSSLLFTNAVHFQGSFYGFRESKTLSNFYYDNKYTRIEYLFKSELMNFGYVPELKADVIVLFFTYSSFRLYLFLPSTDGSLSNTKKALRDFDLDPIHILIDEYRVKYRRVNLRIPKFAISQSLNFSETLPKMGIERLFTNRADLRDITGENGQIPEFYHHVNLEVSLLLEG